MSDAAAREGASAPRILIINDETPVRLLVRVNLEYEGFDVLEAPDGRSGLDQARHEHPDLILLDTMMPGIDGWHVGEKLFNDPATRDIPVVFLAPPPPDGYRDYVRAFDVGGVDYITMPFNPLELAARVRELLGRLARGESELLRSERLEEIRRADDAGRAASVANEGGAMARETAGAESSRRRRHVLRELLTSAPAIVGTLVVVALVGAAIYFGFVSPSFAYNQEQSYAWSKDCLDRSGGAERDDSFANLFNVPGVQALGMKWKQARAVVLFADSTATARQAERELHGIFKRGGASETRIESQLVRDGPELLVYARRAPTPHIRRRFAQCVYLIEQNRWSGWTGFDTKTIGRPFTSPDRP